MTRFFAKGKKKKKSRIRELNDAGIMVYFHYYRNLASDNPTLLLGWS